MIGFAFITLALSSLAPDISGECVNPIYKRFHANHTACKTNSPTCKTSISGVTEQQRQQILQLHNSYRDRIASGKELETRKFPSAADMMQVEWDEELADIAQIHANQCVFEHDCNTCRQVDDFKVGQNLYQRMVSWTNPTADWAKAVESFYEEISITPISVLTKFKGGDWGHFTQVVWAGTWKVGCGYVAYATNHPTFKTEELYTCNYGPAGNLIGSRMYRKGKAASKCPKNTKASTEYTSLCKAESSSGPSDVDVRTVRASNKTLFYCDFSNNSICDLRISHNNNSFIVDGLLGDYLSFVLQPTERITIRFPNELRSSRGFCISALQRKGPSLSSALANNKLRAELKIRSSNWFTEIDFGRDSLEWSKATININWSQATSIKLTFEVPASADEQFYEIKRIIVTEGRCK